MKVEKIYLTCLSHASYILSSNNEAAIVDPQRDIDDYIEILKTNNLNLKYILETHLHADFVSGHLELSKKTGATIVFGNQANVKFEHQSVKEGDILEIGNASISILETPGHTPEGVCFLATDNDNPKDPMVVFTGDTLFAGDVGRPDLMDETLSSEELGGMLYDSLRNKLMTLPDKTKVYPAHGAGSSCGRSLLDVEFSTIGDEKQTNYALQEMDKTTFIGLITEDQPIAPRYFKQSAILNQEGLADVDNIIDNLARLSLTEFQQKITEPNVVILDVRNPGVFSQNYIPNSFNIGLGGRYAEWIGSIMDPEKEIILVADPGKEREATIRAARVGFDNVIGFLDGGFETWIDANLSVDTINQIDTKGLENINLDDYVILDVRKKAEFSENHIEHAENIPLVSLQNNLSNLTKSKPIVVHCQGGYRSTIALSILKKNGYTEVINLAGGMTELLKNDFHKLHLHN